MLTDDQLLPVANSVRAAVRAMADAFDAATQAEQVLALLRVQQHAHAAWMAAAQTSLDYGDDDVPQA